jgi:lipoate-protein ligase A
MPSCEKVIPLSRPGRVIVDGPLPAGENMRRDGALLDALRDPGAAPALRVYEWASPAVTHGRTQDPEQARLYARAVGAREVAARPTGGGLVFHNGHVSFSLAWRRGEAGFPGDVPSVYRGVHGVVQRALARAGRGTVMVPCQTPPIPAGGVCAEGVVSGDILLRGRKVLGGALRVTRWGWLYQGNLWTEFLGGGWDWAVLLARVWEGDVKEFRQ